MAIIGDEATGRHTEQRCNADLDPSIRGRDWLNDTVLSHEPSASNQAGRKSTPVLDRGGDASHGAVAWGDRPSRTATSAMNGDARQAAAVMWRESSAAGTPLTGAQLAERFGRSARWGRDVIASCRTVPPELPPAAARSERQQDGSNEAAAATAIVRRLTALAVVVVAAVAAAASYSHMRRLAVDAGEGEIAFLLPLSVDGLVVAASMSLLVRRRAGHPPGGLAWCALLLGVGASLAANVAAAEPTLVGRLVAAWPPLALLLAYELLMQQVGDDARR
jgi:hypothetical protein